MFTATHVRALIFAACLLISSPAVADEINIFQSDGGNRLRNALENLNPGDRLVIHGGQYVLGTGFQDDQQDDLIKVGNGRLRGGPGQVTEIVGVGNVRIRGNLQFYQSSYVRVSGLTIDGSFLGSDGNYYRNTSAGLWFLQCRNIDVLSNTVSYCGGGGIRFDHSDYINIDNNVVHNTCYFNEDQHSAISIYQPSKCFPTTMVGTGEFGLPETLATIIKTSCRMNSVTLPTATASSSTTTNTHSDTSAMGERA